jgi:uncharacterized protein
MANREELSVIRGARAGRADAQLALGRLYLFGSAGLPKSLPTALHWLDRAAQQGCAEAWQLIGNHIPLDLARNNSPSVKSWYERAYDAGLVRAGLVYAQLVLHAAHDDDAVPAQRAKAMQALEDAARAGFSEAQWLLAREHGAPAPGQAAALAPKDTEPVPASHAGQRWLRQAADSGFGAAQFTLLEQDWQAQRWDAYLARALPLARRLAGSDAAQDRTAARLAPDEVGLLSRCARLVEAAAVPHDVDAEELQRFWELAAIEQDRYAQLALGLWCARMRVDGKRVADGHGAANFKKAVRWLSQAGEQGLAEAWYALSRIYIKPEFSQRNVLEAQKYLERAADMGYRDAQLECGNAAWRARRENENNDVRALYWLQKAAGQGCGKAAAALRKLAPRQPDAWRELHAALAGQDVPAYLAARLSTHPLLAARLELALAFGLSRAEALLLDIRQADRGHCLVIDIRASYGRSRRRLVLIDGIHERQLLDRLAQVFDDVDCGPGGPEGNYRQRLYRLRSLLPDGAGDGGDGGAPPDADLSLAA